MKILSVDKVREGDAYTIKNEPVESIDLMERAAKACVVWIEENFENDMRFMIFCGTGNNGGDGLAIARMLLEREFNAEVFLIKYSDRLSDDNSGNLQRLKGITGFSLTEIVEGSELPLINKSDIVIDAIFGSGLTKPVKGFVAGVINHINSSGAHIISVDVPSGLFCDESSEKTQCAIVRADNTLTFQLPKLAFMFAENEKYAGEWHVLDIGISSKFIEEATANDFLTEDKDIKSFFRPRKKFAHKGSYGHALLIAGGYGKMGAAVLASRACARTGAGLTTAHVPACGYQIIQVAAPEVMVSIDASEHEFNEVKGLEKYNAIAVGPGIGTGKDTQNALKLLIQNIRQPMVFDADAINILGENRTWIGFLAKNSILTPHPKEFERITQKAEDDFQRHRLQREFSVKHGVYVVLKGAYTCISTPQGNCHFNPTGNPGMATGGSGDVLTGMIVSLLAQGYSPFESCMMGVYLHGLAGDFAAIEKGEEGLIAGDIIENIPLAIKTIAD